MEGLLGYGWAGLGWAGRPRGDGRLFLASVSVGREASGGRREVAALPWLSSLKAHTGLEPPVTP